MSIRVRFSLVIGILSIIAFGLIGAGSYYYSKKEAVEVAKEKGAIIFNFLEASRNHFKAKQKPRIDKLLSSAAEQHADVPADLVSGFALTRGVWEQFKNPNEEYKFKQATIDPLVSANKADDSDLDIITQFQQQPDLTEIEGTKERDGQSWYYYSQKIVVEKGCLKCHGNPDKAPAWQKQIYGVTNGYNWKEGDIVSAYIVYISIQKALDSALQNTLVIFVVGSVIVVMLMLVIWFYFTSHVINPLAELEQRTTDISLGNKLDQPLIYKTDNEIGRLYRAVDRLRISVAKMLSRFSQ